MSNLSTLPTVSDVSNGVVPTKIDVNSGKGVPGGFDASSIKTPSIAMGGITSTLAAISAKSGAITNAMSAMKLGTIPSVPGLSDASKKLDGLKAKTMNKLQAASNAPDFTKNYKMPSPPSVPSAPDFKSLGIPEVPSVPSAPSIPSVSSVNVPSAPSVPKLPSIG